jgi:hypothetical protein
MCGDIFIDPTEQIKQKGENNGKNKPTIKNP